MSREIFAHLFFKALANYDLVVTTYGTVMSEMKSLFGGKEEQKRSLDNLPPLKEEALETGERTIFKTVHYHHYRTFSENKVDLIVNKMGQL